jgi:hypothetical protein
LICTLALAFFACASAGERESQDYTKEQLQPYLEAQSWTFYSLDPMPWAMASQLDPFAVPAGEPVPPKLPEKPKPAPDKLFHDYPILGKVELRDAERLRYVVQSLDNAGQHSTDVRAGCFDPRHGIRVNRDGVVHDLLICYECFAVSIYEGHRLVGFIPLNTSAQHTATPHMLNGSLKRAGIPLKPTD